MYLTALEEERYVIAQANAQMDEHGRFLQDRVSARKGGEYKMVAPDEIHFIDISPKQLVSVAAAMVPFLENDDANRALMGANMQRQAVPLLQPEAPLVGTGMEHIVARDSGAVVLARRPGVVEYVSANRIVVRAETRSKKADPVQDLPLDIYNLTKYRRSNQNTCINQRPIVGKGDRVKAGDVIGDGPATDQGELALGRNVLVAFMPWGGYNFEDAILVSERLVKDDRYTSIHIEEFEVQARDTKLGKEEVTRDIPNVSEEALKDLDESGIVRIGAKVKAGDILVGKITPKGETQLTPEEKLLRAIFGEKAGDVRDTSLTVPPGIEGTVVDVKVFSRRGVDKDDRAKSIEDEEIAGLEKDYQDEIAMVEMERDQKLKNLLVGKTLVADLIDPTTKERLSKKGDKIDRPDMDNLSWHELKKIKIKEDEGLDGHGEEDRGPRRRPDRVLRPHAGGARGPAAPRRRPAAGRDQDGEGLRGGEAQALGRRQDGGPPRQQGRGLAHPAPGGHAVPPGRHAGGDRAEPARGAVPHERGPDPRDPSRAGRPGPSACGWRARSSTGPPRRRSPRTSGMPACPRRARRASTTGAPASRSIRKSRWATSTC